MRICIFLVAILSLFIFPSTLLAARFKTVDSTKEAKINVYIHQSKKSTPKEKPVLLVHGFNSQGKVWDNYVGKLIQNGYDVIVVDMRGNRVDTNGDHIVDVPVVGNSWGYGVRELGDDVGTALNYGIEYLNENLPGRDYTKADIITHSAGALAATSYSRSLGLVSYRDNIDTIIELAPPNNGSTNLIANIKQTAQIIPSVFTQSMTAYEYALEFLSGKIWIPGGRMESESLRKELIPESLFLKSIKGLGPDESIKTFIGIGDEDWVVGDWSPVVEDRDDIGYEYFIGLDHFSFCNSELVIQALLDKLEKGEKSGFFSRYKPYRGKNLIAFLSGPGTGIDHPDDTFDVVNFAKGIDISPRELFYLFMRIASRKNKESLLEYWQAICDFDKAQQEIEDGIPEEVVIEKWNDLLAEKNQILHNNFKQASKEYLECPDIAILANGYYNEFAKLVIEKLGEPVRIIDHTFSPSILNEQKVLLIPTGGLCGFSHSDIFRKKLSEFVENGGTLICLSQQYGYDFNVLPTNELKGYGWQEDALCYSKAAYIENFHQILSSQDELYPDLKLDGYFTAWPDNAKILLRRTKNLMPAMLMYDFGKGTVIVAAVYTDWGHINGQAGLCEINLIRDLVRWSKVSSELPEYKIGEVFRQTIEVQRSFSKIEIILKSPDNSVIEKKIASRALYELESVLNRPGIYCVDYILYNFDSEIIQPQTEGFYFSFSKPPQGTVENPDFTFNITTDSENYTTGAEATFTFHISNKTLHDDTIKCKAKFSYLDIEFTESVNVPAKSAVSFDKKVAVTKTDRIMADFYSSGNNFLGHTERGINVFEPTIDVNITTDKMQYAPGQRILIDSNITNTSEVGLDFSLVLNIVDSKNSEVYYSTKTLNLSPGGSNSWKHEFDIPEDTTRGICKIRLNAFSNSILVGSSTKTIDIPGPFLYDDLPNSSGLLTIDMEKLVFKPGESILAKLVINSGSEKIDEAFLDIRVLQSVDTAYLSGIVTDETGLPVKGAQVNTGYTNSEGRYKLAVTTKGKYTVNVKAAGYDSVSKEVEILAGDYILDVSLSATKYGNLFGILEGAIGSHLILTPIDVCGSDAGVRNAVVSSEGTFEFTHLPVGTYTLDVQPEDIIETIDIQEGENTWSTSILTLNKEDANQKTSSKTTMYETEEIEPNNDFDSATEVVPDASIQGKIYDYGDEDYFSLSVDSASTLNISVKNVVDGFRPHLKIYNSERREIISTAGLSGEEIEYSLEISNPETYYLLLKDRYNTFSSLEEYTLEVNLDSDLDEYEPNHDFENAKKINIREEIISTMFPKADEDYFTIDIEEKGILYVKMQNVPEGFRPSLKIYDSSGKLISQKGGSSGEKVALEAEIGESGQYYLLFRDWYSSFSSSETYSFIAYFIGSLDEYEPNDTKEEACLVEFYTSYFGTISTKGDSDFYKLSVPDAGKVIVYLNNLPLNIRPYIKLYKAGRESHINSTGGGAGEDLTMEFVADEPSNYFIQVQDRYNSETSLLRYRLLVVYIPQDDYLVEDFTLFSQTINISDVVGTKEIDIEIPGIDECGKYYLQAALTSSQANSQVVERFYVSDLDIPIEPTPSADIAVSCLEDEDTEFNAGEIACFRFKAINRGESGGGCKIDFKFMDLYAHSLSEFLEPGVEKNLEFELILPIDLEDGLYAAEYVFNGEKHTVNFRIAGLKIEVKAELEDDLFKLSIQNTGSLGNTGLFAEVRCDGFEHRRDFVLMDAAELSFNVPDVDGQGKIYYGIYFSSGKALYLNSFLLEGEPEEPDVLIKVIEVMCDKDSYANGETVYVTWKVDSQGVALLRMVVDLVGPDSSAVEVVDEDVYLTGGTNILEKEINEELREEGLYRVIYRFCQDETVVAQGSIFFDVGEEVRLELQLDEKIYLHNRVFKFRACCFSSFPLRGNLRFYLNGRLIRIRRVRSEGYKEFAFYLSRHRPGQYQAYCTLRYNGTLIESNKINFTVSRRQRPRCPFFHFQPFCKD